MAPQRIMKSGLKLTFFQRLQQSAQLVLYAQIRFSYSLEFSFLNGNFKSETEKTKKLAGYNLSQQAQMIFDHVKNG